MKSIVHGANKIETNYTYRSWGVDGERLQNLTSTRMSNGSSLQNLTTISQGRPESPSARMGPYPSCSPTILAVPPSPRTRTESSPLPRSTKPSVRRGILTAISARTTNLQDNVRRPVSESTSSTLAGWILRWDVSPNPTRLCQRECRVRRLGIGTRM